MKVIILSAMVFTICFFCGVQSEGFFENCCTKTDIVFKPKESVECKHINGGLINVKFLPGETEPCAVPVCGDGEYHYQPFNCGAGKCNVIE